MQSALLESSLSLSKNDDLQRTASSERQTVYQTVIAASSSLFRRFQDTLGLASSINQDSTGGHHPGHPMVGHRLKRSVSHPTSPDRRVFENGTTSALQTINFVRKKSTDRPEIFLFKANKFCPASSSNRRSLQKPRSDPAKERLPALFQPISNANCLSNSSTRSCLLIRSAA